MGGKNGYNDRKIIKKNYIFSVVAQEFITEAHNVHVIIGNSALLKCEIPSFVADFVSVASWVENNGLEYFPNHIGIFIFFQSLWNTQAIT